MFVHMFEILQFACTCSLSCLNTKKSVVSVDPPPHCSTEWVVCIIKDHMNACTGGYYVQP